MSIDKKDLSKYGIYVRENDYPPSYRYPVKEELDQWKKEYDEAFERALASLRNQRAKPPVEEEKTVAVKWYKNGKLE